MKHIFKIILVVLAAFLIWGGIKVYEGKEATRDLKSFSSQDISFQYPAHYYVEEKTINDTERIHRKIILTEDTEENRLVREGKSPGREGPTAITIDIYQNNLDKQTLMQFVTGTNDSNYKMGAGKVSTTTVGSLSGLEYFWSGLYEGRSLAASNEKNIYLFSVTFLRDTDSIVRDFENLIGTAELK